MNDNGPVYVMHHTPPRAYVRAHRDQPQTLHAFGPKTPDHPTVGQPCAGCRQPFEAGALTTLLAIGPAPGDDEARNREAAGRWYNALAEERHVHCLPAERSTS